ncbi:hypothetical protein GCM10028821_43800 [Hymenobacter jeollabukensis]
MSQRARGPQPKRIWLGLQRRASGAVAGAGGRKLPFQPVVPHLSPVGHPAAQFAADDRTSPGSEPKFTGEKCRSGKSERHLSFCRPGLLPAPKSLYIAEVSL